MDIIRDRLNRNACRIVRENLVFQLGKLEFLNDTTYMEIPGELLPESLVVCPVTDELLLFTVNGGRRKIACPAGHGETDF